MPQPVPWTMGTMPSMFGKSASHGAFSAASAMKRATEPEQFTEVRMPR
jgi:hypothetical protein